MNIILLTEWVDRNFKQRQYTIKNIKKGKNSKIELKNK